MRRREDPGRILPREEAPQLWALAERVADRVGTRPADIIYLTPGTQVAVTERGGIGEQVSGHVHRGLILGLGALPGMTQGQLQALLAHEYGHFTNRDTAGGDLAQEVEAAIENMAASLVAGGQGNWYNPAWLFVSGFSRVFAIVALGASRLQEILADRYAVMTYGTTNFIAGLEHVIRRSLTFDLIVNREIEAAMTANRKLANLYTLPDNLPLEMDAELEARIVEVMSLPTGEYDTHPAADERIELIRRLNFGEGTGNDKPALALLPYLSPLQEEMTARVQANLDKQMETFDAAQVAVAAASAGPR
jgi:Zn-dependent protease with chaperone function